MRYTQRILCWGGRGAVLLALLACQPAAAQNPLRGVQRLFDRWGLFQNVQLSGHNTITLQRHNLIGSREAFLGQRWDTATFLTQSSLHAEGDIWKEFGFQADLSASGYGPKYSRWLLGYVGHDTAVYFGDLNIDLGGNEFVAFRKTLKGWQVDQALPKGGLLRYFESQEKGITRRQTFRGNNTSGPYFLTYTPIIEGSEVVKIDEQRLEFGRDYRLDYETGELRFEPVDGPPRLVPETSTISVSYLSYGYAGQPGTLTGMRVEMPALGKRMLLGFTRLEEQKAGHRGDTVAYHEDIYQGSGTTGPFDTTFRPIVANGARVIYHGEEKVLEQALVVLVDNVEQRELLDYEVDRYLGRIIFRRAVPPTSLVVVRYYYDVRDVVVGGASQIWGVDLTWAVSPRLSLKFDHASSQAAGGTQSGTASKLLASYRSGRLQLAGQWRQVAPGFSFLNSVGFYRHEQGYDVRLDYELGAATSFYWQRSQGRSSQGYSFGYSSYGGGEGFGFYDPYGAPYYSGTWQSGLYAAGAAESYAAAQGSDAVSLNVDTQRVNWGLRFAKPRWPGIQLDVERMANSGGPGNRSAYTARQLRVQYVPTQKPYSLMLNWSATSQDALQPSQQGILRTASSTRQFQGSFTYTPSQRLSFSANFGRLANDPGSQGGSSGRTVQLAARWAPSDKLSLNLTRTQAESSGTSLAYGGYPGPGYGGGYYGGGHWGGSPGGWGTYLSGAAGLAAQQEQQNGAQTTQRTRHQDVTTNLSLTYQPTSTLSLDLQLSKRTYASGNIGYLADSDQSSRNVALTWQLSKALSLQTAYGTDTMKFLQEGEGTISSRMQNLALNYRPERSRWGAALMYTRQTGTSPTYVGFGRAQRQLIVDTALSDLSGRLYYRLGGSSDLYVQLSQSSFAGGYAAFDRQTAEFGLQRRLSDTAQLTFGYRYIRNITDQNQLLPVYSSVAMQAQNYIANTMLLTFNLTFHGGGGKGGFQAPSAGMGYYSGYGGGPYDLGGYGEWSGGWGGYGGSLTTFGGYRSDLWARQRGWSGGEATDVFGRYNLAYGPYGSSGAFGRGGYFGGPSGPASWPAPPRGAMTGEGWTTRGPTRPQAPGTQEPMEPTTSPDPWDSMGDGVSLW
jgi:hypothetical protein